MSKKFHLRERAFLNLDPEMRAYVIAIVEDTRHIQTCCREHRYRGEIVLKMADCYEDISLDFDLSNAEQRENSLFKIRKLVEVMKAFRDALEIEAESVASRETVNLHERAMAAVH
jgi:Xaa-Pro aminopeptidase